MRLLLIFGPPAVGKMTVGSEVAARSDFRLFHNHHTVEPLIEVFGWGTPPFNTLNKEFRKRVIEEAAAAEMDLIFTVVWDLALPADADYVADLIEPYRNAGDVSFVELAAGLDVRLVRNRGESRLAAKASKRDLDWSDGHLREMAGLTSTGIDVEAEAPAHVILDKYPYLRMETGDLSAAETADRILAWLS